MAIPRGSNITPLPTKTDIWSVVRVVGLGLHLSCPIVLVKVACECMDVDNNLEPPWAPVLPINLFVGCNKGMDAVNALCMVPSYDPTFDKDLWKRAFHSKYTWNRDIVNKKTSQNLTSQTYVRHTTNHALTLSRLMLKEMIMICFGERKRPCIALDTWNWKKTNLSDTISMLHDDYRFVCH